MGECVAMITWQWRLSSMRRSSFRNSIWRAGDSADTRLVEDEDALPLATFLEEAQKTFAVRVGQEVGRRRTERIVQGGPIEISRNREKTLGAKEPAVGDLRQPACPQR